jgi:FlaG/FlaF family flagellin (archaellin)
VSSVFGVLALIVYVAVIIGLAAAITWLVIKLSPGKDKKKPQAPDPDAAAEI